MCHPVVIVLIGLPIGAIAGLLGGWVDFVIMHIIDVLSSIQGCCLFLDGRPGRRPWKCVPGALKFYTHDVIDRFNQHARLTRQVLWIKAAIL